MRYVPSGLHEIVPPNTFARNVTCWRSPPAAGMTYTLLNAFRRPIDVRDPPTVRRPRRPTPSAVNGTRSRSRAREQPVALRVEVDDAQLAAAALERDRLAVRREDRRHVARRRLREPRLLARREIVEVEPLRSVAIGDVRRAAGCPAPRRPGARDPRVDVTRVALPPSRADAANTSPCTTNATFLPSGASAISSRPFVSVRRSTAGPAGAPRSVIGHCLRFARAGIERPDRRSRARTRSSGRRSRSSATALGHS